MGHVEHRPDRPKPYRAHVNRKGFGHYTKSFLFKKDAEDFIREEEREIDINGMPRTIERLRNVYVHQLVQRYLDEITPSKGSADNETLVLKKFLRSDLAKKSLADL